MSTIYLKEQGSVVKKKGNRILIKGKKENLEFPIIKLKKILIFGNVQITSQALSILMEKCIDVIFLSKFGYFKGRIQGMQSKNFFLREQQFERRKDEEFCLKLAREIVSGKLKNSKTIIQKWLRKGIIDEKVNLTLLKDIISLTEKAESIEKLRGLEGAGGKICFEIFGKVIKAVSSEFSFDGRNRRPPKDAVNVLLSLGYTFLQNQFFSAVNSAGLDPYGGFYHSDRYGRPSLVLDLMEEFRNIVVDRTVLQCIKSAKIKKENFTENNGGITLSNKGFDIFIGNYEETVNREIHHPVNNKKCSYLECMEIQADLLAQFIKDKGKIYRAFLVK